MLPAPRQLFPSWGLALGLRIAVSGLLSRRMPTLRQSFDRSGSGVVILIARVQVEQRPFGRCPCVAESLAVDGSRGSRDSSPGMVSGMSDLRVPNVPLAAGEEEEEDSRCDNAPPVLGPGTAILARIANAPRIVNGNVLSGSLQPPPKDSLSAPSTPRRRRPNQLPVSAGCPPTNWTPGASARGGATVAEVEWGAVSGKSSPMGPAVTKVFWSASMTQMVERSVLFRR